MNTYLDIVQFVGEWWASLGDFQSEVVSFAFSLLLVTFTVLIQRRVKITWGSANLSFHSIEFDKSRPRLNVATEKFFVNNAGGKAAGSVELILSSVPTSYTIFPPRDHQSSRLNDGSFSIRFPFLAPRELLILDVVDLENNLIKLLAVNCQDVVSQSVSFHVVRKFGKLAEILVLTLMVCGVYTLIELIVWATGAFK